MDDVKYIMIPQFEGLTIEDLLAYVEMYPEVKRALPKVDKEIRKLPRGYIANVVYSIVGEPFQTWV